jgi:hypothetical protein
MQAAEISRAIITSNFSNEEFSEIINAIKFARSQLSRKITGSFVIGTRVQFTNPKTGVRYTGKVNKVKQKFILVDTDVGVRYNVPAAMLKAA